MNRWSLLAGILALIGLAGSQMGEAQTIQAPQILTSVISLVSFDPPSLIANPPKYPIPVTLKNTVSGTPTHYRVSRFSDFHDAQWLAYQANPVVQVPANWLSDPNPPSPPNKQVVLYFQVRAANPRAGFPTSLITDPATGKTTTTTQPAFIESNVKNKTVKVTFFG